MTVFQLLVFLVFLMMLISFLVFRGNILRTQKKRRKENPDVKLIKYTALGGNIIIGLALLALFLTPDKITAAAMNSSISSAMKSLTSAGLGFIGAGLSTGLASIGAGWGTGIVGSASIRIGRLNAGMLGKSMIFAGLANGVATYGLIISILILSKI